MQTALGIAQLVHNVTIKPLYHTSLTCQLLNGRMVTRCTDSVIQGTTGIHPLGLDPE